MTKQVWSYPSENNGIKPIFENIPSVPKLQQPIYESEVHDPIILFTNISIISNISNISSFSYPIHYNST